MGPLGMANPNVTGFYFDDYWLKSGEDWHQGEYCHQHPSTTQKCGRKFAFWERCSAVGLALTRLFW